MLRLYVSEPAKNDIRDILRFSIETFGAMIGERYEGLIDQALICLQNDPLCVESTVTANNHTVRRFHLRHARRALPQHLRIGNPRHVVLYQLDNDAVFIPRILHDSMDPLRHMDDESGG